jgi:hypothetical protein
MPRVTCFSRNRCTGVEQLDGQTIRSSCRLQDTFTEAVVEITARLPDLEITAARGEIKRSPKTSCFEPTALLEKVIGVRIGSGMQKIFEGLLEGTGLCKQLIFMLEECCHGVILSFTKGTVQEFPYDEEEAIKFLAEDVKKHIRLYNRCAAFSPGSRIVEGIESPH